MKYNGWLCYLCHYILKLAIENNGVVIQYEIPGMKSYQLDNISTLDAFGSWSVLRAAAESVTASYISYINLENMLFLNKS